MTDEIKRSAANHSGRQSQDVSGEQSQPMAHTASPFMASLGLSITGRDS